VRAVSSPYFEVSKVALIGKLSQQRHMGPRMLIISALALAIFFQFFDLFFLMCWLIVKCFDWRHNKNVEEQEGEEEEEGR